MRYIISFASFSLAGTLGKGFSGRVGESAVTFLVRTVQGLNVKVRFFTRLREITGTSEELLELPARTTVRTVLERLSAKHGRDFEEYLSAYDQSGFQLQFLVNGRSVANIQGLETEVKDGDTLAIVPPVGGGDRGIMGSGCEKKLDDARYLVPSEIGGLARNGRLDTCVSLGVGRAHQAPIQSLAFLSRASGQDAWNDAQSSARSSVTPAWSCVCASRQGAMASAEQLSKGRSHGVARIAIFLQTFFPLFLSSFK